MQDDRLASTPGVLFVDDDKLTRLWFSRAFGEEFRIVTAGSSAEALLFLAERGVEFGVLVTDYRMPNEHGMDLLRTVQREHRHLIRILATAYAEKDVAIQAVNDAKVLRILEKPLDEDETRAALREAMAVYRAQAVERAMNSGRADALRDALGFIAHELNTPLATVRLCVSAIAARLREVTSGAPAGELRIQEDQPGEIKDALARAESRALYCQSVISTFVQSTRDAHRAAGGPSMRAGQLLTTLLDSYPFEAAERLVVKSDVQQDFTLPGQRDLVYLVGSTILKNALEALKATPEPMVNIALGVDQPEDGPRVGWVRFDDNGPGIPPDVLARLTLAPVTTRADGTGGMGLLFTRRVMESLRGEVRVEPRPGGGTRVTLLFRAGVQPVK